jgi:hypothetical protein
MIRVIKSRRVRPMQNVVSIRGRRNGGGKEGRRPFGRHRHTREYIEMSHEGMGWEGITRLIWQRTGKSGRLL